MGFHDGSNSKESACNATDMGSIPESGRSPGGGHGNPLESCLENPTDRGVWWATVQGVAKSQTWLSTHDTAHTYIYILLYIRCALDVVGFSFVHFVFWPHCVTCRISPFPDQGLNLGHGSENAKFSPPRHQGTPLPLDVLICFDTHHKMVMTVKLADTFMTSHTNLFFFFLVARTFKIYSLSKFMYMVY